MKSRTVPVFLVLLSAGMFGGLMAGFAGASLVTSAISALGSMGLGLVLMFGGRR